jgi:hypothetical protein
VSDTAACSGQRTVMKSSGKRDSQPPE